MEREVEEAEPSDPAARARAAEERALLQAGRGDLPVAPLHRIAGAHGANVLAVRLWPGEDQLVTGTGEWGWDGCWQGWAMPQPESFCGTVTARYRPKCVHRAGTAPPARPPAPLPHS
jgi:hypothetical protein